MFAPADYLNLEHTAHPKLFENQNYVWDALKQIASYLQFRLKPAILGELMGKPFISNHVFIGKGTIVEQGAMLKGPAWIGENCRLRTLAQVLYVIRIAIQHRPSDACGGRHARHLRQCGPADGLEHNRVRTVLRRRLNGSQNLSALIDGVVVRVNNLRAHAQLACGLLGGLRLLNLVIVIVGGQ